MKNKVVLITGGSSGLGLALAQECLSLGASHIHLIARNRQNLINASLSLIKSNFQQIHIYSVDIANYHDLEEISNEIKIITPKIDYLFANAGYAKPGLLNDLSHEDFINQVRTNYLGDAYAVKIFLPLLTCGSHLIFSGSVCSVMGFVGYSAYSPSKFALKGLSDSLRNELFKDLIYVHICLISTMDTPGLVKENETKPKSCKEIEGTASIFLTKDVSHQILQKISNGEYIITFEVLTWFIAEFGMGICPSNNIFLQILIAPFIPIIRFGVLKFIDFISKRN
jgi:short-subunit dehydrogenase